MQKDKDYFAKQFECIVVSNPDIESTVKQISLKEEKVLKVARSRLLKTGEIMDEEHNSRKAWKVITELLYEI